MNNKKKTLRNLKHLRNYWANQTEKPPHMVSFGGILQHRKEDLNIGRTNDCGTVRCALGAGPEILELSIEESDFHEGLFSYSNYGRRLFPALYAGREIEKKIYHEPTLTWSYLFECYWPNSIEDLVRRFDAVIANELTVTSDMKKELWGAAGGKPYI